MLNKLGVFGGSFNPVHYGHLILAQEVLWQAELDQILFIPAKIPPHKKEGVLSEHHRFRMLELSLKKYSKFVLSNIEFLREKPSYTYDTIEQLKLIYPRALLYFITGADGVFEITGWYRGEELLTRIPIIAVTRAGIADNDFLKQVERLTFQYGAKIQVVKMPEIGISSSLIRDRILKNQPVAHLLPEEVYNYIIENNLYR